MADEIKHLSLSNLKPARGSTQSRKRIGRGVGSGIGKTSGKGHKGHKARTRRRDQPRLRGRPDAALPPVARSAGSPTRSRSPRSRSTSAKLKKLAGQDVTPETLFAAGLISKQDVPAKLLAAGDADRAYTVRGVQVSASAKTKIEAAGGRVEA